MLYHCYDLLCDNKISLYLTTLGLIGFAQKLHFKRSDKVGIIATTFLLGICMKRFLLGGLMADAATETMLLIRLLDSESLNTADFCEHLATFLDHIAWMFHGQDQAGVFKISGHAAFIKEWLEGKVHHYVINKQGHSVGGVAIPVAILRQCLEHMIAWCHLVKTTCAAEFPNFEVVSCFSVFKLPRSKPSSRQHLDSYAVSDKLKRLQLAFRMPNLIGQFKKTWHLAWLKFEQCGFQLSYWDAWRDALSFYKSCDELLYVVLRGQVYAPVTSKVEQSFSLLSERLGSRRLLNSPETEDQSINIIMATLSEVELDAMVETAQTIWKECFKTNSRTHQARRADLGVPKFLSGDSVRLGGKCSEKQFLKNITSSIRENASGGSAASFIDESSRPSTWTAQHEAELQFQKNKRRKKLVDACINGRAVESELGDVTQAEVDAEAGRRVKSFADRCRTRAKFKSKTTASPPTQAEINDSIIFMDEGVDVRSINLATARCTTTTSICEATLMVSRDPRMPSLDSIKLVAMLKGLWIVSPDLFVGPCIKYRPSLATARIIFATEAFKAAHAREWLVLLEVIAQDAPQRRWKVVASPLEWAATKAIAEKRKTPSQVIALVVESEQTPTLKHAFTLGEFMDFVRNVDDTRGSIGLLGM
jgi:hypothetical protein